MNALAREEKDKAAALALDENAKSYYDQVQFVEETAVRSIWSIAREKVFGAKKVSPEGEVENETPIEYYSDVKYWPRAPFFMQWYLKLAMKARDTVYQSEVFNNFILVTIIIAGINVGMQTYPAIASNPNITLLDYTILGIFCLEIIVKTIMEGFAPLRYIHFFSSSYPSAQPLLLFHLFPFICFLSHPTKTLPSSCPFNTQFLLLLLRIYNK